MFVTTGDIQMTNPALNETYNAMYAQLEAMQRNDEPVCSDWYAQFSDVARRDYDENRSHYEGA
jgi:hypothetical protein